MRDTPTRVFWEKRLDLVDSKGVDFFESGKERQKRLQAIENTQLTNAGRSATQRALRSEHRGRRGETGVRVGVARVV